MGSASAVQKKQQIVQEIVEKIKSSQGIVLVDYRGLDVTEDSDLRKKYREANVDYKVYKNTLMRFAFKEAGLEEFNEYLTGPNAVAFGVEDPVSAAKVSQEFSKGNESLEIKAGIVDGKVIDMNGVKSLADLPPRDVLIAQVLGGLNSPISGLANVLQGTVRNLVYALNAVKEKKESEA